jgi:hypothetical protein
LWQNTCYEAFFAVPGAPGYWELNLSSLGRWNLYWFQGYRDPSPARASQDFSLVTLRTSPSSLHAELQANRDLSALDFSLCAVVVAEGKTHYLSTAHAGTKPDFHLRASFTNRSTAP